MTGQATPTNRIDETPLGREARSQLTSRLLHEALQAGEATRQELRRQVVVMHLDAAESVAWRYRGRGQDHEDLVQVARLGLVEAVERFDPDRGPFLAFATPTMVGEVKRHFRDHSWAVRPPRGIQERQHEISRARNELTQALLHEATVAEIASHLKLTEEEVRAASNTEGCFQPASLDVTFGDGSSETGYSHADRLGEEQPEFESIESLVAMSPACLLLGPADRQILHLRFFVQCTQDEIGRRLGISQMQVSRRLRRILTQLRATIGELEAPGTPEGSSGRQPDAVGSTWSDSGAVVRLDVAA